jgi:hypothetical protein
MGDFLKSIGKAIWERVFLSYKSTLIGIGIAIGITVLEQASAAVANLTQGWAKVAGILIALALASLRSKALPPPAPVPPQP